jgi:acyl-CoA thioester hydrolase
VSAVPTCPFCGAGTAERVGQWGGQLITEQWRCTGCDSYFEAIRGDVDSRRVAVRLRRRVEWIDTDAAGIYHWTTIFRFAEAAEAELHTSLGIADLTFGATPRVAVTFDLVRSLRFNDEVTIELAVDAIGRTSIRYAITVTGPEGLAAQGRITACLVGRDSRRPTPWPDELRRRIAEADADAAR